MIGKLVLDFYARVRLDPAPGPIFNARIEDRPAHLDKLAHSGRQ